MANRDNFAMNGYIDHLKTDGITAYAVENHESAVQYRGRRDYYKISFLSGIGEIHYGHLMFKIEGPVLLISKPGIHCTWRLSSADHSSCVCAFTDEFLDASGLRWKNECEPFFSCNPVLHLTSEQEKFVRSIFCRMIDDQKTTYRFKEDLIQNQICVLIHLAFRMAPLTKLVDATSFPPLAAAVFLELVELQFPRAAQIVHFN